MRSTMLEELLSCKIIAILRGVEPEYALQVGQAILDGGVKFMEITMNTTGAEAMIAQWRAQFSEQAYVGAGTVIDLEHAKRAVAAGAQFMISPNLDLQVIDYAKQQGVPIWPGVMTPTEIIAAMKAGVDAVKLFPMGTLGVNYLREIRGPIADLPIIATGGVRLDNINDYFEAGANAVGMGSKLVDLQAAREGKFQQISETIAQYVQAVSKL
ncbi:bifunctional 2-keto-4-hydroxyglutarate aldolase/2-keto-3-deoxy-6-phosphogluconate aldolase [Paenibacillus montaniterrae]|uniref:Bifunctional 2-keto-4-hydroxyglutarate aldolase/2-keto-3-deoxy-6-phosphogluconate aldolase n=1 Tax=Paenibacillus montaniterrae TaxID=429341 RepID=A0A919YJY7_9BACL|nr:bifunctional 4-hydroxy-2-oxoglutarate aldolase/2-dehydro-3-deoxy-phosphogluconate aldolase [Paenibacillus montaniterrae]GIP15782.1 bifunctional 2-keto-4-hydroxyglutarate aldolase/2-keto-3-deoxy-6-phosphogluconate aldolase [Paenibacillus montaniterrae]